MKVFTGSEYSSIYFEALQSCYRKGDLRDSRIGNVLDLGPTCFEIKSLEAGLPFIRGRGINPFFAFAELAWFIEGSDSLAPLKYFIDGYGKYSDDGVSLYGAYGYRAISKYGFDQIESVIGELRNNPESRRAVVSLFNANDLLSLESLDIPCNLSALFKIRDDCLDITVFNRSNDVFKGVPYNFFLFRFVQYYVARKLSKKIGVHRHITDSLHLYKKDFEKVENIIIHYDASHKENIYLELDFFDRLMNDSSAIHALEWESLNSGEMHWLYTGYQKYKKTRDSEVFHDTETGGKLKPFVEDWLHVHYS